MKQRIGNLVAAASVALIVGLALTFASTQPVRASDDPLKVAIDKGLAWIVPQQNVDGSWGSGCHRPAYTGLVVTKLATRALELGKKPTDPTYEYADEIAKGVDYILTQKHDIAIGMEPAGDPDGNGNGIGVYFNDCGWEIMYQTGIAMMALSAVGRPADKGVVQDAVDFVAWAQADPACGAHRGGWRYWYDYCDSDNSNSGYVSLGLGYAAASPPYGFGITIPPFVYSELTLWLDVIQDDVNGDPDDGGSWYDPGTPWVNILKTGNLIYEMGLTGDTRETARVKDAVDYIERHWADGGSCTAGWRGHRQAMFAMMKGLESLGIQKLDLDGDNVAEADWFAEVSQHLVDTQQADGSWPWDCWGDQLLSTTWALLTLEKTVPPLAIPVAFDIKPGSCPNPIQTGSAGVLPVAIAGTATFDVTQIDPASVVLGNPSLPLTIVALPLRWSLEDVATPYEPFLGKQGALACHTLGADGIMDLALKFDTKAVVPVLGAVTDGQVVVLQVRGKLKAEFGATPFVGEDVVRVLLKK